VDEINAVREIKFINFLTLLLRQLDRENYNFQNHCPTSERESELSGIESKFS